MRTFNLEERLIDFAVLCIGIAKKLPKDLTGLHLADQLIRSGTSTSLNYGEAQSAESKRDFIHKIRLILKELRETKICLKIILRTITVVNRNEVESAISESDELISIFVKSEQTARKNIKCK